MEDIHMSWIPPESTSELLLTPGRGKSKTLDEIGDFPIVQFTSVQDKSINVNNEMEPWRKKYAKDCNKTPPQSSRSQQCPLCVSNATLMSPNEFKS